MLVCEKMADGRALMPRDQDLATYWRQAELHEASGDYVAAQAIYARIVELDPTQAFAWLRLGMQAQRRGSYREARRLLLQGLDVAVRHRRWRVLPYLTMHLLTFDERDVIRTGIEQADWEDPVVLSQSAVLTQQLWLVEAHESALRHADLAIRHAPASHLLAYVRGMVLKYLGRMDEATAALERSIELQPTFADAHWALSFHARSRAPGARIDRIKAAQRQAPGGGLEQAYLGYALFKEYDSLGDTTSAWRALAQAASVKRSLVTHDPGRERLAIEKLRDLPIKKRTPANVHANADMSPIFIVGMPRTGTTLLERILGNHSNVSSAGELNAFSSSMSMASDQFCLAPPTLESIPALGRVDLDEVAVEYRRKGPSGSGSKHRFTDKNPTNIFNAGLIAAALPDARIICMRRNPMDACFSNLKELFAGSAYSYSYDLGELASHFLAFSGLVKHWEEVLGDRFLVVDYEDLVANPLRSTLGVMDFCGLAREPQCVDILSNQLPVSTASSSQVREPIHERSVGAWQRYSEWLQPLSVELSSRH